MTDCCLALAAIRLLHLSALPDLSTFNKFFMDKEEDAVIKLQALADRIAGAQQGSEAAQDLKAALVDFHGEQQQQQRSDGLCVP